MRQLHCPECKSNKASLSGRCETCGREMVPMLGVDVIEPLKAPITDVIPTQELLSKFHDRVFATMGIPAEYLGESERTADRLMRTGR